MYYTPTPLSVAGVPEPGDVTDVGDVQALLILSSELVEDDFDPSL